MPKPPPIRWGDEGKARLRFADCKQWQVSMGVNSKAVESLRKKTLGFQPREAYNRLAVESLRKKTPPLAGKLIKVANQSILGIAV